MRVQGNEKNNKRSKLTSLLRGSDLGDFDLAAAEKKVSTLIWDFFHGVADQNSDLVWYCLSDDLRMRVLSEPNTERYLQIFNSNLRTISVESMLIEVMTNELLDCNIKTVAVDGLNAQHTRVFNFHLRLLNGLWTVDNIYLLSEQHQPA